MTSDKQEIKITKTPSGGYGIHFPPHPDFPCPNDEGELLGAYWCEWTEAGVQKAIIDIVDCIYHMQCGHDICTNCGRKNHKEHPEVQFPLQWCVTCNAAVKGPYAP